MRFDTAQASADRVGQIERRRAASLSRSSVASRTATTRSAKPRRCRDKPAQPCLTVRGTGPRLAHLRGIKKACFSSASAEGTRCRIRARAGQHSARPDGALAARPDPDRRGAGCRLGHGAPAIAPKSRRRIAGCRAMKGSPLVPWEAGRGTSDRATLIQRRAPVAAIRVRVTGTYGAGGPVRRCPGRPRPIAFPAVLHPPDVPAQLSGALSSNG